jgi:hypothetical protein
VSAWPAMGECRPLVQRFGNHESRRTTKLCDRTGDKKDCITSFGKFGSKLEARDSQTVRQPPSAMMMWPVT